LQKGLTGNFCKNVLARLNIKYKFANIRFFTLPQPQKYLNTYMSYRKLLFLMLLLAATGLRAQQKVIPLYNGPAPGSENWTWSETENDSNLYHSHTVYNVSHPTLTVYPADSQQAQRL
jgi:hypothetical protein